MGSYGEKSQPAAQTRYQHTGVNNLQEILCKTKLINELLDLKKINFKSVKSFVYQMCKSIL